MTQNVDRETVVSRLLAADDILILCHKNPDGDTIGSVSLRYQGKFIVIGIKSVAAIFKHPTIN